MNHGSSLFQSIEQYVHTHTHIYKLINTRRELFRCVILFIAFQKKCMQYNARKNRNKCMAYILLSCIEYIYIYTYSENNMSNNYIGWKIGTQM